MQSSKKRSDGTILGPFIVILLILALWQVLSQIVGGQALSTPFATLTYLGGLLGQAWFLESAIATVLSVAKAFAIAAVGGVIFGTALGGNRLAGDVFEPIIVCLYSVPKVVLYPVILLTLGIGEPAKIAFGVMHGILPLTLVTMHAVRNIRPVYVRAARSMRMSPLSMGWHVLGPSALPEIFGGLRLCFSLTMLGVMLGELFASQKGLGHLLMGAIELNDVYKTFSIAILLSVFALTVNFILLFLDRRLRARMGATK